MHKRVKKILSVSSILFSSLFALTACNNDLKEGSGAIVFNKTAYVDLNNVPDHLNIKVDLPNTDIEYINIGTRVRIKDKQIRYIDGILSIDTKALYNDKGDFQVNSGDRVAKIKCKGTTKIQEINILFVDKVIKNAQDLQDINKNPSGSYILANDIDCSSISNFEPLGFATSATSSTINKEFLGVFDGNGYAIKNLTSRYSNNMTSEETSRKTDTYLFENESHKMGNMFGVFQLIGPSGIVRNTAFKNVHIFGRTIAGVIAGQNSGLIENCFIDENCTAEISTHFYDESCNVGGICGLNDADDTNQCIRNVISLAKCSIADQFVGYGEEYIEGNKERLIEENKNNPDFDIDSVSQDELMRWTFYGGTKGSDKKDSNGVETNGVYGGVGISYGAVMDCYAANFAIKTAHFSAPAYFGQTHVYLNKIADGPDTGSIRNCAMKTMEELKDASLYSDFPTDAWNIYDGEIPSLSAYYSYFVR